MFARFTQLRANRPGLHVYLFERLIKASLAVFFFLGSANVNAEPASQRQATDSWDWSLAPYLWLMDTELKTPVAIPEGDGDPLLAELIERVDFAAQIHVEGRRGDMGFFLDISNLQLSDNIGDRRLKVKTDSGTTLVEAAGLWTFSRTDSMQFELMAGVRYLDASLDLTFAVEGIDRVAASRTVGLQLADAMIGARASKTLSDSWQLAGRTDIAAGGTDFSWNLSLLATRDVGRRGQLVLGYRHFDVDFDAERELLAPTLVVSGPVIGYNFRL